MISYAPTTELPVSTNYPMPSCLPALIINLSILIPSAPGLKINESGTPFTVISADFVDLTGTFS